MVAAGIDPAIVVVLNYLDISSHYSIILIITITKGFNYWEAQVDIIL